ncbi:MAG: LptF/LptG family permease [Pseudomonadota bacterium]|nr:LptF/LptG family permease [Pseudomonadota bacterium]
MNLFASAEQSQYDKPEVNMYLTNYFKQLVLSRALKYLLIATMLVSFIETLEHLFMMPFSLSIGQNVALWVLSWPMYVSLLMPMCVCGAMMSTHAQLASSQELAIMQMYMSPSRWLLSIGSMVIFLSAILFATSGWLVPWCYGVQTEYAKELLSDIRMPRTLEGQFNNINIGGKKLVIYRDKKLDKGLFVATSLKEGQGLTVMSTEKVDVEKKEGISFIRFKNGKSYTFDKNSALRYVLEFDESQIPLDLSKGFGSKHKVMKMSADKLYGNPGRGEQTELAWRIHMALPMGILVMVSFIFADYLSCRRHPAMVYGFTLIVTISYYVLLMMVRSKAQTFVNLGHLHMAYGATHMAAIILGLMGSKTIKYFKK